MKMPAAFVSVFKNDRDECVNIVVYAHNTVGRELTEYSLKELGFSRDAKGSRVLDLDVPLKNPFSQSECSQIIGHLA